MMHERFLIELKTCLINGLLLCLIACSSSAPIQPVDPLASLHRRVLTADELPVAPWAVWRKSAHSDPILAGADRLAATGALEEALVRYQDLATRAQRRDLRIDLIARELGTLLQMGLSQRVLERASQFVREENFTLEDSPSGLSLMVGYAYIDQENVDQAVAWFAKSIESRDPGVYSAQAKSALENLIRSIPRTKFAEHEQRWQADRVVGKLFVRERLRRAQGGAPEQKLAAMFFSPESYRTELPALVGLQGAAGQEMTLGVEDGSEISVQDSLGSLQMPSVASQRKLGVLLPLSGQYAEHALKVKHGIELAAQQATPPIPVEFFDTKGEPMLAEQGYINLVTEGAAIVLGPLLVKTTEQVASRTGEFSVPIISFTKRSGIPELGPAVFRLGVTVENQVDELLYYAVEQLGLRRFAILNPELPGAREYADYFRASIAEAGGLLVVEQTYYPGDVGSIEGAVGRIALAQPDAIFIPDQLDHALPLLDAISQAEIENVVLLGPALWDDPVAIRGYGQLLEGAVYVTPYNSTSSFSDSQFFSESYRKTFARSPELLAAQAFDAASLAIAAIDSRSSSGAASQSLFALPEHLGVTGALTVTPSGEIYRRMSVMRLYKGEVVEVVSRGAVRGIAGDVLGTRSGEQNQSLGASSPLQERDEVEFAPSSGLPPAKQPSVGVDTTEKKDADAAIGGESSSLQESSRIEGVSDNEPVAQSLDSKIGDERFVDSRYPLDVSARETAVEKNSEQSEETAQ